MKVLESPWKVLEFKSYKLWGFAFVDIVVACTLYACHQYLETVFDFSLLAYLLIQNSHCIIYSLNFEKNTSGFLLLIILMLEKCIFGSLKVLEFCALRLLWTLELLTLLINVFSVWLYQAWKRELVSLYCTSRMIKWLRLMVYSGLRRYVTTYGC